MIDKRKFPRFEATFQIRYCSEDKKAICGYTLSSDVSMSGLKMPASSGIINKGDAVKLSIKNASGAGRIFASGKVKWVRTNKRNAPLDEEAGIEFTEIHPADMNNLLKPLR